MAQLPPTLKNGSKGETVKGLQNALNARSYDLGPVDGVFGAGTEKAVKEFQTNNGLVADGIVGPATWEALGVYTVQPGDTLSGIAEQQLGDGDRWSEIFELNRGQISDPDMIFPGQVLALPA